MTDQNCCTPQVNDALLQPSKIILVAAIILINDQREILITQRPTSKIMAGLWEFPGGKVGEFETPEAALVREVKEELNLEICAGCLFPLTFASHRYEHFHLLMPLYGCYQFKGNPEPMEGQAMQWVKTNQLKDYPMPEANRNIIGIVRDILGTV